MPDRDNSCVFPIEQIDEVHAAKFNPALPWLFETDEMGAIQFATESGACMAQREYRKAHGFDPETGERS
jgi:hypothetical protein